MYDLVPVYSLQVAKRDCNQRQFAHAQVQICCFMQMVTGRLLFQVQLRLHPPSSTTSDAQRCLRCLPHWHATLDALMWCQGHAPAGAKACYITLHMPAGCYRNKIHLGPVVAGSPLTESAGTWRAK